MPRRATYWLGGVLASWLAYTVVWTWISLQRFYSLRATIYDLGIYAELGSRVYSTALSPAQWIGTAFNYGGMIFLSPTTLGGYPVILAAQAGALGSGAVALYFIARQYALRPWAAFALSSAYLLYFPLDGINFTDAHLEVYLIPLFLFGVCLLLRGNFVPAFVLFLLAGDLQFPMVVFPFILGLQLAVPEISQALVHRLSSSHPGRGTYPTLTAFLRVIASWKFPHTRRPIPRWFAFGLPVASLLLLVGALLTSSWFAVGYTASRLVHAESIGLLPNLTNKFWTLFLLLAPLAFLPVLSPRWLLLCVPFFALMFGVNYFGYTYPYIATSWYSFLVVPFLALATVEGVAKIGEGSTWIHALLRRAPRRDAVTPSATLASPDSSGRPPTRVRAVRRPAAFRGSTVRPSAVAVGLAVTATLISTAFLAPYGPWNSSTSADFGLSSIMNSNRTLDDEFVNLARFIPPSDPAVLLQNDMPGLLPRPLLPGAVNPLVVGPFPNVAYNFTRPLPNGSWAPIDPDFVIADPVSSPYNFFDNVGAYPYNLSMEQAVSELYATYNYGIVGEASEMLLLKHYYTGPLLYYVPYSASFSASSFTSPAGVSDSSVCGASCLLVSDETGGQVAWFGPYTYLSPGTYSVSIHLGLANWLPADRATIQVTGEFGHLLLNSTTLSGLTVGPRMTSVYLNSTVFVGNGTPAVEFRSLESDFQGSLAIYGVSVHEVAPPSSVYRLGDAAHDTAVYRLLSLIPSGATVLADPSLRPYFHNLTLVSVPANGTAPSASYELYDPAFPSGCSTPNNATLCSAVNRSYTSGAYSILAQDDGVTLLAQSPANPLEVYSPFEENVSTAQLITEGAPGQGLTSRTGNNLTVTNQTNGGYAWYGPYASLPPGTYEAQFELSVSNNSPLNHMVLRLTGEAGHVVLGAQDVTGSSFPRAGAWVTVNVSFVLSSFTSTIECVGTGVDWTGSITLAGVQLIETAPPS